MSRTTLVIRLGAMGDIIHTLPAVATLKKSFPENRLVWLVATKWTPLLEGNPFIDELIPFRRNHFGALKVLWRRVRALKPVLAVDFQGLIQSALIGRIARAQRFYGFDRSVAREPLASMLYTDCIPVTGPHRVERNIQLAIAAGASEVTYQAWVPTGRDEGDLPTSPFVLTNPFAGWASKQWPIENYERLGQRLNREGFEFVANVPENRRHEIARLKHVRPHTSSIAGLIAASRRSTAVVGVDSGPLHLAAALHKPGVALFGPTDPARTGPYGESMIVLRAENAKTTYARGRQIHPSMKAITVERVADSLLNSIAAHRVGATRDS